MKSGNSVIFQASLLILVLFILIQGLIQLPNIAMWHIIVRSLCVAVCLSNFTITLIDYLQGR